MAGAVIHPALHHAWVFTVWTLRRPAILALAACSILGTAAMIGIASRNPGDPALLYLLMVAPATFGPMLASLLGGPTRGWDTDEPVARQALPHLPLAPLARHLAEILPPLLLGLIAATIVGGAAGALYLGQPTVEAAVARLADRFGEVPVVRTGVPSRPLHEDQRWQVSMGLRQFLPILLLSVGLTLALSVWLHFTLDAGLRTTLVVASVFFLGPAAMLLAVPAIAPLGLNGKVAVEGASPPTFSGELLRAWALLPVDPKVLRRAALRTASWTFIAGMTVVLVLVAGLYFFCLWHDLEFPTPAIARAVTWSTLFGLATVPLVTALQLGERPERRLAGFIVSLPFGITMLWLGADLVQPGYSLVVAGGGFWVCGALGAWLIARLCR